MWSHSSGFKTGEQMTEYQEFNIEEENIFFGDYDEEFDEEELYQEFMRRHDAMEFQRDNANNNKSCKENKPAFEVIYNTKLEDGEEPLSRVIGHANQKKELLAVIEWFKKSKELKERGVSIPKGVVLFGKPGNGKSLFIKEIIRCAEAPVFVFSGEQTNIVEGIVEVFKQARKACHAIIVIDEIDLLINKERRVIRALQECLDGVESTDDILVLTATNFIRDIPEALLRNGRLEKLIKIPNPTGEEALELFKKHFRDFKVALPEDFDDDEVALTLNGISCAGVKALVNDIVLRNGFENITTEMIFNSIFYITDRIKDAPVEDNIQVAIHEAGHAVMARAFQKYFIVNRINMSSFGGEFHAKQVNEDFWPYEKVLADIQISMAGNLAEKILCGEGSRGCESDLQRARIDAYNAINLNGYSSCWETLPNVEPHTRAETQEKRRLNEKKIESLLKKCEKKARKYLKQHKQQIEKLAQALFEKKHLKSSEILSLIG